jgi:hypothetical protein
MPQALRARLVRKHRATLKHNVRAVLRDEVLDGSRSIARLNVHFTPLARDGALESVLVMFEIASQAPAGRNDRRPRSPTRKRTKSGGRGQ